MATLQQQIRDTFLTKLEESGAVDVDKVARLRVLMADGKKLKAEDVIKILTTMTGGGLT